MKRQAIEALKVLVLASLVSVGSLRVLAATVIDAETVRVVLTK